MQITVAALGTVFLIWAAFSSVVVVFKDRIIAAEDHHFLAAQEAFEAKIGSLQISYDDLVGRAARIQDDADRQVARLRQREQGVALAATPFNPNAAPRLRGASTASPGMDAGPDNTPERFAWAIHWLGLVRAKARTHGHHPGLERLAADTLMLAGLSRDARLVAAAIEGGTLRKAAGRKALIATTGIDADDMLRRMQKVDGVGGPDILLGAVVLDRGADRDFSQALLRAEANLQQFSDLNRALSRIPTARPLGGVVERTSGFGPRLDPFSGHYAFHPGIDFAGPTGTAVLATAAGQVTFAGRDGTYGNMVEIAHGFGLKTRYAHLLSVNVVTGQAVAKGASVGKLGSTGRSTGPHVHYEVWYDDKVRNPDGFLRAGQLAATEECKVVTCSRHAR
ncbi:MAG TPA: M23 family metallopeptidase [Rhizomicrobium sp.]